MDIRVNVGRNVVYKLLGVKYQRTNHHPCWSGAQGPINNTDFLTVY